MGRLRLGVLIALVPASLGALEAAPRAVGVEVSAGVSPHPLILTSPESPDNLGYATLSLGAGFPLLPWLDMGHSYARDDGVWALAVPLTYGVKTIVGAREILYVEVGRTIHLR